MAPFLFSKGWLVAKPESWSFAEQGVARRVVWWFLHRDARFSSDLQGWLWDQVSASPSAALLGVVDQVSAIVPKGASCDDKVWFALRWVRQHFRYVADTVNWRRSEYWATPEESVVKMSGDCEDGSILLYYLLRRLGVPANRLLIWTGAVVGGGHCCLFYKPEGYPLDFVSLDWCYYPSDADIQDRPFYEFEGRLVFKFVRDFNGNWTTVTSKYLIAWFYINESISYYDYEVNSSNN